MQAEQLDDEAPEANGFSTAREKAKENIEALKEANKQNHQKKQKDKLEEKPKPKNAPAPKSAVKRLPDDQLGALSAQHKRRKIEPTSAEQPLEEPFVMPMNNQEVEKVKEKSPKTPKATKRQLISEFKESSRKLD